MNNQENGITLFGYKLTYALLFKVLVVLAIIAILVYVFRKRIMTTELPPLGLSSVSSFNLSDIKKKIF